MIQFMKALDMKFKPKEANDGTAMNDEGPAVGWGMLHAYEHIRASRLTIHALVIFGNQISSSCREHLSSTFRVIHAVSPW